MAIEQLFEHVNCVSPVLNGRSLAGFEEDRLPRQSAAGTELLLDQRVELRLDVARVPFCSRLSMRRS